MGRKERKPPQLGIPNKTAHYTLTNEIPALLDQGSRVLFSLPIETWAKTGYFKLSLKPGSGRCRPLPTWGLRTYQLPPVS
ncbi:hypothetical protein GCM10027180_08100 [Microbulbifer echini]